MKKLLLLLNTFIALACNGQDKVCLWSDNYVDSLKGVIASQSAAILNLSNYVETQTTQLNNCYGITNEMGVIIGKQTNTIDSLYEVNESIKSALESQINPTGELIYYNDTIDFRLIGEINTVTISKRGAQINYQITEGLHRLNTFYNDKQFRTYLMYDTASYDSWLSTFAIPVK